MDVHHPVTPAERAGFPHRVRPRSCRTIAATLRTLEPRLREVVILIYCLLGGRSSRLTDHRRALLLTALLQVERRRDLRPLRPAEIQNLLTIRRRLAADLGVTAQRARVVHAA